MNMVWFSFIKNYNLEMNYIQNFFDSYSAIFVRDNDVIVTGLDRPLTPAEQCGVVYTVNCETCGEEYVGETIRPLETWLKEHKDSVTKQNTKSALGEHVLNNPGHTFNFEKAKVIDRESRFLPRKVTEAIHIKTRRPQLNRQWGYELPGIYTALLEDLEGGQDTTSQRGRSRPVTVTSYPWRRLLDNNQKFGIF